MTAEAHAAGLGVGVVMVAVLEVSLAEAFGDEVFEGEAEQFLAGVAEEGDGLGVDEFDEAALVDDNHGVWGGFEEAAEFGFGAFALGDIADGVDGEEAVLGVEGAEGDFGGELGAIAAEAWEFEALVEEVLAAGVGGEGGAVLGLESAGGFGDEAVHGLADEFAAFVSEEAEGLDINELDEALGVGDEDGVGGGFHEVAEALVGIFAVGDVAGDAAEVGGAAVFVADDDAAHGEPGEGAVAGHDAVIDLEVWGGALDPGFEGGANS